MILSLYDYEKKRLEHYQQNHRLQRPLLDNHCAYYANRLALQDVLATDKVMDGQGGKMMIPLIEAIINHQNGRRPDDFTTIVKAID